MTVSTGYLQYVLEQVARLGHVDSRRMFGGAGLYCKGLFFGLISGDVLYLRADDANRRDYEQSGMPPFRPHPDRPQVSMAYYEVPAGVLEDSEELVVWARKSVAAALAAAAGKKHKTKAIVRKAKKSR
jgi:DNA transformation protein